MEQGRVVKAGRRPPVGEALTTCSGGARNMDEEAGQGFLGASGFAGARLMSPRRWWWAGSEVSTMRRRAVVRLAATLMFAGRDRRSGIRRKLPLRACS
jgi:hypothetical protein